MNLLKKKIKCGEVVIGSWLQLPDVFAAEIMARAGFDWLAIDMEHGLIDLQAVFKLIQAVDLAGAVPLVRLNVNDASTIRRVMDAGAGGVIVPMVNTAEEARAAVDALKYSPLGKRSYGLGRAHDYGRDFDHYVKNSNENSFLAIQIEHIDAVKNLDAILKVNGIDAVIIGPYDLSGSLGKPGKFDDKEFMMAIKRIAIEVKKTTVALGFHIVHPDENDFLIKIKEGFTFIGYGMDTVYLAGASNSALQRIKGIAK